MAVTLAKVLYGALFVLVLPALLVLWARGSSDVVALPAIRAPIAGSVLASAGACLVLAGWWALRTHGGGLPMNAFPPPRHVTRGAYALVSHPIYVGFSALVLGVALVVGSGSGLWLVAPTTTLACVALVEGYERHDLEQRFGPLARPWLALPPASNAPPTWGDRAFVWLVVLLPWAAVYELVATVVPPDPIDTRLPFEATWPVVEWAELAYVSLYAVALASPLALRTRAAMRTFAVRALLAMALVFPLYLALPFVAPPRPFVATSALGRVLALERAFDTESCALPSFHVVFALLLADALQTRARASRLAWVWGIAVAASCVATGMHSIADVLAGAATFAAVRRADGLWEHLRRGAERVANSWREVRIGPIRVIKHGLWAALGTFVALAIVGAFARTEPVAVLALVWGGTLVGAAAWAQWIEGASGLSRPYGFWGGLLGATLGGVASKLVGQDPWIVLAATCVSAPFIQSLGRLRCLEQGCCHGRPTSAAIGIAYRHPRSRVWKVPELRGRPLHPTQLYSILWNVVVALAVVRLAWVHAAAPLTCGVYLILAGLGRFVEESFRGEPQTPSFAKLRVYQWASIAAVIAGAILTAQGRGPRLPSPALDAETVLAALVGAGLNFVAFGVDFPESRRRFSRLA